MKRRGPEEEEREELHDQEQRGDDDDEGGEEEDTSSPAGPSSDLCQSLILRYSTSSSPHHLHLTAAATSFRSILQSSALPLTPPSYFAAAISTLQQSLEDRTLTSEELGAMLSFLSIVLPMVPDEGVSSVRAKEAVGVLAEVAGKEVLGVGSLVCAVKCVGVLLVMFCDKEDWGSVEEGFGVLLGYLLDRRPKVRRSAQECLEKVFKSFQSNPVLRKASKIVLSTFEKYMPVVASPIVTSHEEKTMVDPKSKSESKEFSRMLNFVGAIFPHLTAKVRSQIVTKVHGLITSPAATSTSLVLKIIEAFLDSQIVGDASSDIESIIVSISAYVMMSDSTDATILSAANLLKVSMVKLHSKGSLLWIKYLPRVCLAIAGLLATESGTASAASSILRDIVRQLVNQNTFLFDNSPSEGGTRECFEINTMKETCATFENALGPSDEVPNPHLLSVISILFLMLGKSSYFYMKSIVVKLAHFISDARRSQSSTVHVRSCIGYAVAAIGVERMLSLFPIELNPDDFTCKNTWMVPILRDYAISSSLAFYMDHIVPLAKSFRRASRKVSDPSLSKDLQSHSSALWKLLPAFCRSPTDTSKQYRRLAELLVDLLKKEPLMRETVALGVQVLVSQNISGRGLKKVYGKLDCISVEKSIVEIQEISGFSEKTAARDIKAIASASSEVLRVLSKLFVESVTGSMPYLKDAIGSLASISDSSFTKEIFLSLLQSFGLNDGGQKVESLKNPDSPRLDKGLECSVIAAKDKNRCRLLELACAIVEGAKEDLVNLIFSFIKDMMQEDNDIVHCEAYLALAKIVEDHPWFCSARYVELMDFIFGFKSPSTVAPLKSRFTCFHALMVYSLGRNVEGEEEEDARTFLILNEVILTLKNSKEELRKEAYDMLLKLSSTLKGMETVDLTVPDHKLVNMILGYLSSPSPQIKSGAVSALSVLVYNDANICKSIPDLVPSLLSLLENKAVEVTKAILGFVKVIVSCMQAPDLQNLLSEVVSGIIPWSDVSRHHFRSKVTIILEILIRKCGSTAVQSVIPDKYEGFLKTVMENRHSRPAKEASVSLAASTSDLPSDRKEPGGTEKDSTDQRKRKRSENNHGGTEGGSESHRGKRFVGSSQPRGIGNKGKRKFNQFSRDQNQGVKQKARVRKVGGYPPRGHHRDAKKPGRGGKTGFRRDKK
ncbi:hypothetical protein MLD38_025996 [Melastoma candidum]|uniref:Uncharacterized protein n=1 Tax=Melastoma candidum TaxID=119954 RepID=A0ACB9P013_9MYRT|nr:hypothetical protein MLD38_025996 [Melastoma candidum]